MLAEWFRLWFFPPAAPTDARVTHAPPTGTGMTPMVTDADIPAERRALLLGVQERHHQIISRLAAAHARKQVERIQERRREEQSS